MSFIKSQPKTANLVKNGLGQRLQAKMPNANSEEKGHVREIFDVHCLHVVTYHSTNTTTTGELANQTQLK